MVLHLAETEKVLCISDEEVIGMHSTLCNLYYLFFSSASFSAVASWSGQEVGRNPH